MGVDVRWYVYGDHGDYENDSDYYDGGDDASDDEEFLVCIWCNDLLMLGDDCVSDVCMLMSVS